MHRAQSYINTQVKPLLPQNGFKSSNLSAPQATGLRQAVLDDAYSYMYSGAVSIAEAINALDRSLYTWATVKLYYSVFYLARSLIACSGTAIVYDGTKCFSVNCRPGASPVKRDGSTHKAVLGAFGSILPGNPLLSQPIDNMDAPEWLMARREDANYKNARFYEPAIPAHFAYISKVGIRKSISAYINDDVFLYTFDPEHAMLALPVEALKLCLVEITACAPPKNTTVEDAKFLSTLFQDRNGPIADIIKLINTALK